MQACFVTATGTDIGKSFVTAGLLRAAGGNARAIKPMMSGYDPALAAASDAGILLAAMGREPSAEAIAEISPWRYAAPLSADMAARRENRVVSFEAILAFCRDAIARAPGPMLIEGVGGVMAPLDAARGIRELIAGLGIPALLVTGSYLGCISHTLTAAEALRARGVPIAAIALNESETSPVPLEETAASISGFLPETPLFLIPRHAGETYFSPLLPVLFGPS